MHNYKQICVLLFQYIKFDSIQLNSIHYNSIRSNVVRFYSSFESEIVSRDTDICTLEEKR